MSAPVVLQDRRGRTVVIVGRCRDGRALVEAVIQGRNAVVPQNALTRLWPHDLRAPGTSIDRIKRLVMAAPLLPIDDPPGPPSGSAVARAGAVLAAHFSHPRD